MKTSWIIIADDLSGAAEIAGIAHQFGLSARIIYPGQLPRESEEDVTVINTDTRNMTGKEAASRISSLMNDIIDLDGAKLFKKTDSLLRGPVAAEILAILDSTAYSAALLVPANPTKGRRIKAGQYLIGTIPLDETEYKDDPEYPRTSPDIRILLKAGTDRLETQLIDWEQTEGKILVPDLSSVVDISALIEHRILPGMLLAGGADFFRALLHSTYGPARQVNELLLFTPKRRCFILGSHAAVNREALKLLRRAGYKVFEYTAATDMDAPHGAKVLDGNLQEGASPDCLVLKLQDDFMEDPHQREMLLEELTSLASGLGRTTERPVHFLVTGGRTASLLCRKMGWDELRVRGMYEEGAVTLSPGGSNNLITIKPGAYVWPEELLK